MNKKIQQKLCQSIDQLIVLAREAAKEDMVPQLQADEIIDELLDARRATTAQAARDPETVAA